MNINSAPTVILYLIKLTTHINIEHFFLMNNNEQTTNNFKQVNFHLEKTVSNLILLSWPINYMVDKLHIWLKQHVVSNFVFAKSYFFF